MGADTCADILARYATGETAKALAEEYGVSRNAVLNLLRRNNVVDRRQPPSTALSAQLSHEYEAGATIAELVAKHGNSYGAIRRVLTDAGVEMRPRGGSTKRG